MTCWSRRWRRCGDRDWRLTIVGATDRAPETARSARAADRGGRALAIASRSPAPSTTRRWPRAYAGADLFVMPSLFEGYGMVLTEALARGLPIICTTGGAAAETAPDAAALKVPPGDVAALASSLAPAD